MADEQYPLFKNEPSESTASTVDQLPIRVETHHSINSEYESLKGIPRRILQKCPQSELKKILKPKQPVIKRYFTAGVNVNEKNARKLEKEPSPFAYPQGIEELAYKVLHKAWRNDERIKALQQKCFNRPSYKDRQRRDLLNRLYVEKTPTSSVKTVTDINPDYFKIVQGRPIPDKLDIREYIQTVRDSLRTNVMIGYREDDIALIDENLCLEQSAIDIIKENLQSYVNTFEDLLLEDHSSAMRLLKEADEVSKIAYDKYHEHTEIAQKVARLNFSLFNVEEKWKLCKTYQKFLYAVSPLSWRMRQGPTNRKTSIYVMQKPSDDFIAKGYRSSILTKGISVMDIVQEFQEETFFDDNPQLFFTKPEQLMEVFRFMEMQNLNALLHTEELALPLEGIKDGMKVATETFDKEIRNLQETIDVLEGGILWEENRVKYLEELATNLLENEFKDLIVEEDVLNLGVIVEDLYESRIGPNDANIGMIDMMKAVEEQYRQELLFFDNIPSKELALLEGSYYEEEVMMMKLAEKATRQFEELERITHNLKKAYEPPMERRTDRELKKRTPPVNPPKKVELPPRSLTKREEDYLQHFTQFCKHIDDPKEYGIDTNPGSEEKKFSITAAEPSSHVFEDISRN